jgi:hypothetical protein
MKPFAIFSLLLLCACGGVNDDAPTSTLAASKDILRSKRMPDGKFEVLCADGSVEIVTTADMSSDNVCKNASDADAVEVTPEIAEEICIAVMDNQTPECIETIQSQIPYIYRVAALVECRKADYPSQDSKFQCLLSMKAATPDDPIMTEEEARQLCIDVGVNQRALSDCIARFKDSTFPEEDLKTARDICTLDRFGTNADRIQCLAAVQKHRTDFCTVVGVDTATYPKECNSYYFEGEFNSEIISACTAMQAQKDKASCLAATVNKKFDKVALAMCTALATATDKVGCFQMIADKTFDEDGVSICQEVTKAGDKIACLQSIANKNVSKAASVVCKTIPDIGGKISCLNFIADKSFDADATPFCSVLADTQTKLDCLAAITGKDFDADGIAVCRGLGEQQDQLLCLQEIANKQYQATAASICSEWEIPESKFTCLRMIANRRFVDEAVNICNGLFSTLEKQDCLEDIVDVAFDGDALDACTAITEPTRTRDCMMTIAGASFNERAVNFCRELLGPSSKISCLKKISNKGYFDMRLDFCYDLGAISPEHKYPCLFDEQIDLDGKALAGRICDKRPTRSFPGGNLRQKCHDNVAGKAMDLEAAYGCENRYLGSLHEDIYVTSCLREAAGRNYRNPELYRCLDNDDSEDVESCLRGTGVPF